VTAHVVSIFLCGRTCYPFPVSSIHFFSFPVLEVTFWSSKRRRLRELESQLITGIGASWTSRHGPYPQFGHLTRNMAHLSTIEHLRWKNNAVLFNIIIYLSLCWAWQDQSSAGQELKPMKGGEPVEPPPSSRLLSPRYLVSEWVGFKVPINTLQVISETSLSSQSLALVLIT